MKKNLIAAAICGLSLMASGAASAVMVGGVDFGLDGSVQHIDTTNLYETYIDNTAQTLTGYGRINSINTNPAYAGTIDGTLGSLYVIFTDYVSTTFSATAATFTGGVIDVYLGRLIDLSASNSNTNLALIKTLTPYAEFVGHASAFPLVIPSVPAGTTLAASGTLTGTSVTFNGSGLIDAKSGFGNVDAFNFFKSFTTPDGLGGFGNAVFTSNGNTTAINTHDTCTKTAASAEQPGSIGRVGEFCLAGTTAIQGVKAAVVPEPGVLALLGLGLLGMCASLCKRKSV